MLKKITTITLALALTACANTDKLDASITTLTNKVDALSAQVANLEKQQELSSVAAIETDAAVLVALALAEQAAIDAKAANDRVDNMVASYKK